MSSNTKLPNLDTKNVNPIIPAKNVNTNSINSTDNKTEISINNVKKEEYESVKNIIIGYYIFSTIAIILYFLNDGKLNKEEYYLQMNKLPFNNPQSEYSKLNILIYNYIQANSKKDICIDRSKAGCLEFRLKILDLIKEKEQITKEQKKLYILMYNSYSHQISRLFYYAFIGYVGVPIILLSSAPLFIR